VAQLCAKFEVSSFIRSRDMKGVQTFKKVGHVTHSRPLLTDFCIISFRSSSGQSACQIWSF